MTQFFEIAQLVARLSDLSSGASVSERIHALCSLEQQIGIEHGTSSGLAQVLAPVLGPLGTCILSEDLLLSHHAFRLVRHIHTMLPDSAPFPIKRILPQIFVKLGSDSAYGSSQASKFLYFLAYNKPPEGLLAFLCKQIGTEPNALKAFSLGLLEEIVESSPGRLISSDMARLERALVVASADGEDGVCIGAKLVSDAYFRRFPKRAAAGLARTDTVIIEPADQSSDSDTLSRESSVDLFSDTDDVVPASSSSFRLKRTVSVRLSQDAVLDSGSPLSSQDSRGSSKRHLTASSPTPQSKLSPSPIPVSRSLPTALSASRKPLGRSKSVLQARKVCPDELSEEDSDHL